MSFSNLAELFFVTYITASKLEIVAGSQVGYPWFGIIKEIWYVLRVPAIMAVRANSGTQGHRFVIAALWDKHIIRTIMELVQNSVLLLDSKRSKLHRQRNSVPWGSVLTSLFLNINSLPFCLVPIYFGVKLNRSFTFRDHSLALRKKLSSRVTLLRRHAKLERWAKTLCTAALPLAYSAATYCTWRDVSPSGQIKDGTSSTVKI